jgi:hypothetical protein
MRKYLFIISFSALLAINTAFAYECKPTYWNACSDGDCESGVGDMTIYSSESEQVVSRCDKKGCTTLKVEVARSGVMLKAASATNSYLLVINTVDLKFTEIATLLTTAYVKSGSCAQ